MDGQVGRLSIEEAAALIERWWHMVVAELVATPSVVDVERMEHDAGVHCYLRSKVPGEELALRYTVEYADLFRKGSRLYPLMLEEMRSTLDASAGIKTPLLDAWYAPWDEET